MGAESNISQNMPPLQVIFLGNRKTSEDVKAQACDDGILRLFDKKGVKLCDIDISLQKTQYYTAGFGFRGTLVVFKFNADNQMKRLRIVRREPWKDWPDSNMSQARVRFK